MIISINSTLFGDFNYYFIGIYAIYNSIEDVYYIGMSLDIFKRLDDHRCDLMMLRHKNQLFQAHYQQIVASNLDPSTALTARPLFMKLLTQNLNKMEEEDLMEELLDVEAYCIHTMKDCNRHIYNIDRLTEAWYYLVLFKKEFSTKATQVIHKIKMLTTGKTKINQMYLVDKAGEFWSVEDLCAFFCRITNLSIPVPLFWSYLTTKQFTKVFKPLSISSISDLTNHSSIKVNIPNTGTHRLGVKRCVQILEGPNKGQYKSISEAAFVENMSRSTLSAILNNNRQPNKFKFISHEEYLKHNPINWIMF